MGDSDVRLALDFLKRGREVLGSETTPHVEFEHHVVELLGMADPSQNLHTLRFVRDGRLPERPDTRVGGPGTAIHQSPGNFLDQPVLGVRAHARIAKSDERVVPRDCGMAWKPHFRMKGWMVDREDCPSYPEDSYERTWCGSAADLAARNGVVARLVGPLNRAMNDGRSPMPMPR